ncbi:unnamed protein product [Allacma fusca]|uniref:Uncharacterized protein n=1 Tax=Allacma fusca TaxID=39272 RepID=A0A8J2K5U9_9HEXA|nr:unnamed protein product [Allacma fusca]
MASKAILIFLTTSCSLSFAGTRSLFHPPQDPAQDRVFFDSLDPTDIFTKWGPFGYFNQYLDPSNAVGPEILKGFGSPFMPYNGYNIMESITTPPLQVPPEATSTAGYDPDLFAPPSSDTSKESTTTEVPTTTAAYKAPGFNGHSGGYGAPMRPNPYPVNPYRPQITRGAYNGPASQFVGYHPAPPNGYPAGITVDMNYRRQSANHGAYYYH